VKQVVVVLVTSVVVLISILLIYQIPLLYLLSGGLQTYHDRAYYYDQKIKIVLFHLSAAECILILLLILYNEKIFWTQLPNQFGLDIINGGIIVKNNYFFQE
jgi:hypothetical protein